MKSTDTLIIGGGLTGLTTAFYLKKKHQPFLLLEQTNRLGGVIKTEIEKGFTYECGPNTGVIGNLEAAELFEDLAGKCELETAEPSAKKRLIWKNSAWRALPSGPVSAIKTPLFAFKDKIKVLGEPFRKKGNNPLESVAEMVKRRMGQSFLDYAIDPFIAGIYAGNPELLVTKYALPKMYALEQDYGSLIKGGIKKSKEKRKDERLSKASRAVFSVKGGLENLIKALGSTLDAFDFSLNTENTEIQKLNDGYCVNYFKDGKQYSVHCKSVICTTGAYTLQGLLPFLAPGELLPISNLKYNKIALVLAGYSTWNGTDIKAFGGLVPTKEKRKALGVLFTSSIFKDRAPKGGALLSLFMGGTRMPEATEIGDDELKTIALNELQELMGVSKTPDLFKIFRYPHAIAQYEANSKERLAAISKIEAENPGLYLAGNIRDGIGMADRIKQGKDLSETILNTI